MSPAGIVERPSTVRGCLASIARLAAAFALAVGLSVASPLSSRAGTLDEEAPDVVFTSTSAPAVAAKAVELGNDPVRIYEFVRNELEFQNYFGLMKGPEATLLSGGGNDYDLAALLVSLMRAAGIPARFVRGRIYVTAAEATAWTGTQTLDAAFEYLNDGAKHIWIYGPGIELAHVWVEAHVPMAFYRGRGVDSAMRGKTWIPLDPSFKLTDWSAADPDLPIGSSSELILDYTSATGLYSKVQPKLPAELFDDQVRAYLAAHPTPGGVTRELEDVRMHGAILKGVPGVLPNGLPYGLSTSSIGPWITRRAAGLSELHVNSSSCLPTPSPPGCSSYWPAIEEYRYKVSVVATTRICTLVGQTYTCTTEPVVSAEDWSVAWEGKPVLLNFPPEDPNQVLTGYDGCTGPNGPIETRPRLWVGDVETDVGDIPVDLCSQVAISVLVKRPPVNGPTQDPLSKHTVAAGGTYLASFDLHGGSEARTRGKAQTLVDAVAAFPIVLGDPNGPFIDSDGNGDKNGAEKYLAANFEAQRALTGGLLDLANAWYWEHARSAETELLALHHARPGRPPATGLVSAGKVIEYLYDIPFAIQPANLLIDLGGVISGAVSREDGLQVPPSESMWNLIGHSFSAMEHAVWEEIAGFEAISTVKGFQLGREVDGQDLLVLKNAADADAATPPCQRSRDTHDCRI